MQLNYTEDVQVIDISTNTMITIVLLVCVLIQSKQSDTLQMYSEDTPVLTFHCPTFTSANVDFYLVMDNRENQLYSCTTTTKLCSSLFNGGFALFNSSGSYFQFNSTNTAQRRLVRGILCVFMYYNNSKSNYTEDVVIIAKAQGVNCFQSILTNNNANISITCKASKIYPAARCTFNIPGQVSYSHVNYNDTVDYFKSNCTWTSSLLNFKAGNYTLTVTFYPYVTIDTNFATSISTSFQLTVPNIFLSRECFEGPNIVDGYIRPGSIVTCVCYLDNIGYPPAIPQWLDNNNVGLGIAINSTATSLTIEPFSNDVKYKCTRSTQLINGDLSVLYTINYARGPNMCSVELKDLTESIWHMCSQEYIHLTVICKVDLVNCVPGFKAIISINSIYLNVLDGHNVSDTSQVNQDINITEVGTYSIGCQAQNVKFNDTKISCSYLLQIFGPPLTPPVIQIASTSTYTEEGIQENKVYTVQCKTFGGVPLVNNITVSCGNIESTQSGNIFTSPILFTRFMTGQNCTCTAQHITGCYENNTSTLQLNILYKSAVIEFNVTSNIIENGKSVQFYCEADGNPTPKMFIVKENETIAQNSSGYYLYYNKSMSCRDAGYYFCQTNNGIDVNSEETKQVTVFVRCPLQFTSNEILKNFSLQQGMLFSYKFTVYGYPEPDKITIFKSNQVSNNIIVTNSSLEPPYVTVELKIFRLSLADFGFYTLLIFQNGLLNLSLNFIINEELEANKETDINVGAVVGGCIAACSVVILVVVVVVVNRKYEITCKKKVSNKEPKKTQTYSELSLLQQLKDRHNYETPIHNRNLSNNEVTDKTANYMNVEEMDTMIGNENSLYCNTQNENVHQQITKTVAGYDKGVSQYEEIDNIKP